MRKPGAVTAMIGVLILVLAGGILLASEESTPIFKHERSAPAGYVKHGDYVEYEGGILCRVMSPREPYTETCPPSAPTNRVYVRMHFAEHVRGTELEQEFLNQFRAQKQAQEEK